VATVVETMTSGQNDTRKEQMTKIQLPVTKTTGAGTKSTRGDKCLDWNCQSAQRQTQDKQSINQVNEMGANC